MERIIVFRYNNKFDRNREVLKFIKFLNPQIRIFGIYGGPVENYKEASECLKDYLVHNYLVREQSSEWKWKNGDITYQQWFRDYGHKIDFDFMHAMEWDLFYFEPVEKLFAHVPPDALALSGLIPLWFIKRKWYWTNDSIKKREWAELMKIFKHNLSYKGFPYASAGPGTSLPRVFLEKIQDFNIPELTTDEIRIPLLAQIKGMKMVNTYFVKCWFSRNDHQKFNCDSLDININTIRNELSKRNGRRVFHPFRDDVTFEQLMDLYVQIPSIHSGGLKEKISDSIYKFTGKFPPMVQYFDFLYPRER